MLLKGKEKDVWRKSLALNYKLLNILMVYRVSNGSMRTGVANGKRQWRDIGEGQRAQERSYALRLLVKLGLGLPLRDVKNEGTSGDVHENKGEATKCTLTNSAFSQKTQDFGDNRRKSCPLVQKNLIAPVERSGNCLKNNEPLVRCFNYKSFNRKRCDDPING